MLPTWIISNGRKTLSGGKEISGRSRAELMVVKSFWAIRTILPGDGFESNWRDVVKALVLASKSKSSIQ